jgi:hypothetical protein
VGADAKVDLAAGQRGQLRQAQAGVHRQGQQGVVASSGPGGLVGGVQQRVGLGLGEVGDEGLVVAFGRDRQHPLDDGGILGVVQGGEAEQGVDRGQAGVAGPHAVAALALEVVQERADQPGVQVGDLQAGGRLAGALGGEAQQQLAGVAVGGDGVGAGLALADEPVGEVGLQGRGQRARRAHGRPLRRPWPAW